MGQFFGKYRGTVLNNIDPMQMGRLQASVPDVANVLPTSWALPCLPLGGIQAGIFTVPAIGASVWIEFEHGDPDYPIWTGCFLGHGGRGAGARAAGASGDAADRAADHDAEHAAHQRHAGADGRNPAQDDDPPPPPPPPAMISISDVGITISNGQGATIMLAGPSVTVNAGALVVT